VTRLPGRLDVAALVLATLVAGSSRADSRSLNGFGSVSGAVGWRLTPNDYFYAGARAAGRELAAASPGGPAVSARFGYSATENLEIGINLHASGEFLRLEGAAPITSVTYGALVSLHLQWPGLVSDLLVPYLALSAGPTLVFVSSPDFASAEVFSLAWSGGAGVTYRLGERLGVTLDYRFLLARGVVPDVTSVNGGGHQVTLGVTVFFSPEPLPGESPR
jgi:opacity protein-like surface antigen